MTRFERRFPGTSDAGVDVYLLMHERIREATTRGGLPALQQLLQTNSNPLAPDESECGSWLDYQGRFLGVFGAFFYFYDSNVDRIRLINARGPSLSLDPPTLDVSDGKWFRDDSRHSDTLVSLGEGRENRRANREEDAGHVEFYQLFQPSTGQKRFTKAERRLNVLTCPDGEVGFFIFEYILRSRFQKHFGIVGHNGAASDAVREVDAPSVKKWLQSQFDAPNAMNTKSENELLDDESIPVSELLTAYGLMNLDGSASPRSWLVFEWLDLQFHYESVSDIRFLSIMDRPWFTSWRSDGVSFVELCEKEGPLSAFRLLADLLSIRPKFRRTACSVNEMARFFVPSHMTYRYQDSGIPKTVYATPLGNVGEQRHSVAFVVGALHLEYDGLSISQRQFWEGLTRDNRQSLSAALTTMCMLGEAVESGLREEAAMLAANKIANERFVDATVRTFSIITHETKSLFLKHFIDLRNRLEVKSRHDELTKEVCYAWDLMAASTSIAYLFSKVVSLGDGGVEELDKQDALNQLHGRFLQPLAALFLRGELETALRTVAHSVVVREGAGLNVRLFPFCEADDNEVSTTPELSPEEFAHCYMLITEPIRNFVNYGLNAEAEWSVTVSRQEIVATLRQQLNEGDWEIPDSQTFRSLGEFLSVVNGCGAARTPSTVRGRRGVEWTVTIAGNAWKQAIQAEDMNPDSDLN